MKHSRQIPGFVVPEGRLFGHPTRLVDSWSPEPERIVLPSYSVADAPCSVEVRNEATDWASHLRRQVRGVRDWRAMLRRERAKRLPPHEHGAGLFWDAREIVEGNISHVLLNMVPRVVFAQNLLREETGEQSPITVILRWRAASIACRTLDRLGIPYLCTDAEVTGRNVRIAFDRQVFHPSYFAFPIPGYTQDTPERVFIARRGARALLNDREVGEFLATRGFERFYFEEIDLALQWSILRNAKEIVAVHGAALGGLPFNKHGVGAGARPGDGPRVIELFGAGYIVKYYREFVAQQNGAWGGVRGPITSQIIRDLDERGLSRAHANTPFRVDLDLLDEALAWVRVPRQAAPREIILSDVPSLKES